MTGRIVIDAVHPATPTPSMPAKVVIGEAFPVSAVIFRDGHDQLAARARLVREGEGGRQVAAALRPTVNDRWEGRLAATQAGPHLLVVEAWTDRLATWAHRVRAKLAAGQELGVELADGAAILDDHLARHQGDAVVGAAASILRDRTRTEAERVGPALGADVAAAVATREIAFDLTASEPRPLWVDRQLGAFGAWYELFPRSYGGFKGAEEQVARVAAMGFDVLYVPPIHPIGVSFRKGRNNTLWAGPDDPGSPWAIGSADGGHTAIHPDLGTIEDFRHFKDVVSEHGMELALDYALQCSPDHPWVAKHPEWFHRRADGTIAYAENPPKKYQDIYPINFWPERDHDRVALWQACKDVMDYWIDQGVRVFRVDNPHTKPIAFWEWLIAALRAEHPDVVLLAEAFTRPRVMEKLAEVGFTQSYTYFTWRTQRDGEEGLWAYMETLTRGPAADYFRPNFWPNTPDILSGPLRNGPPAAFALRLVLAATLSPCYGVYSGYELYENQPASDENEEYLDSEKYQLRPRVFDRPGTLAPLMAELNAIRRRHPAFQRLRNLLLVPTTNPQLFAYAKVADDGDDAVLVVVTLDPYGTQDGTLALDLGALGLPADTPYPVIDELTDERFIWSGPSPYVRFDPWSRVAHVLDLGPGRAALEP